MSQPHAESYSAESATGLSRLEFWNASRLFLIFFFLVFPLHLAIRIGQLIMALGGTPADLALMLAAAASLSVVCRILGFRVLVSTRPSRLLTVCALVMPLTLLPWQFVTKYHWSLAVAWAVFVTSVAIGHAVVLNCTETYFSGIRRLQITSIIVTGSLLSMSLGALIADAIIGPNPRPDDYRHALAISSIIPVLVLALAWFERSTAQGARAGAGLTLASVKLLLTHGRGAVLAIALFGGARTASDYLAAYCGTKGIQGVSWFFVAFAVMAVGSRLLVGRLRTPRQLYATLIVSLLAVSGTSLLLLMSDAAWMLVFPGAALGIGVGFGYPLLLQAVADTVNRYTHVGGSGLSAAFHDLGAVACGMIAAAIGGPFGFPGIFVLLASLGVVAIFTAPSFGARD